MPARELMIRWTARAGCGQSCRSRLSSTPGPALCAHRRVLRLWAFHSCLNARGDARLSELQPSLSSSRAGLRYHQRHMTKQHILDEIRRTAKDGVALGVDRFFKETGIRESDWRGRFWARWGDAVKEAGLQQSQWQGAFEDDVLLEKLIAVTRELGRFPVFAELNMRARSDSSFPDARTFQRLGSKQQLIAKVRAYCGQHSGFEDVLALCPPGASAEPASADREREE